MITKMGADSVRDYEKFEDTMKRYHGDIERNIYSAEILCTGTNGINGICRANLNKPCPFRKEIDGVLMICKLYRMRVLIGDTFEQHHTDFKT